MPSILDQCKSIFKTKDLYKILCVDKSASQEQLKKAYYRKSLQVHPDKVTEKDKEQATVKFQLLCKIYGVLSDAKRRKAYDNTGEVDDDDDFGLSDDKNWEEYWRELFPAVSIDDINDFTSKFKGSDEELSSLKEAYLASKGDMQKVLDSVMCATIDDEDRFRQIITQLIEEKELPTYKKFTQESGASRKKRQSKASKEAKEAEQQLKKLSNGPSSSYGDLALAIKRNREKRGDLFAYLEEKYAKNDDSEDDLVVKSKKRSASKPSSSKTKTKKQKKA